LNSSLKRSLSVLYQFLAFLVMCFVNGLTTTKEGIQNLFSFGFWEAVVLRVINDTRHWKAQKQVGNSWVPVAFTVMEPAGPGLGDIIKAGLGFLFVGIFSIVILAVLGQFAAIATIWPAANVTKITTNIANSVVTGSAFLSILVVLIMVGFIFVVIGLLQALIT
jgi:hypothetical protein